MYISIYCCNQNLFFTVYGFYIYNVRRFLLCYNERCLVKLNYTQSKLKTNTHRTHKLDI